MANFTVPLFNELALSFVAFLSTTKTPPEISCGALIYAAAKTSLSPLPQVKPVLAKAFSAMVVSVVPNDKVEFSATTNLPSILFKLPASSLPNTKPALEPSVIVFPSLYIGSRYTTAPLN